MNFRTKFLSTRMMAKIRHLFLLLFVLATVLPTAAIPPKPSPQRLVNDFAGLFTAGQVDELERKLVAFDDSTSNQITVVTVNDLEGRAAAEYADRIGIEWGVGSKAYNNGIVVLVKPKTSDSGGQVTIQVGYGLEGTIPDIYASRIIRNDMIPHFQENDYYGGVVQACENLMALASGEISEPRSRDDDDDPFESLLAMLVILFLILLIIKIIRHSGGNGGGGSGTGGRDRHIWVGPIGSSSWGGSSRGSSWGGRFGGGFGGGFGGFGGGSFGGGGASGSW